MLKCFYFFFSACLTSLFPLAKLRGEIEHKALTKQNLEQKQGSVLIWVMCQHFLLRSCIVFSVAVTILDERLNISSKRKR